MKTTQIPISNNNLTNHITNTNNTNNNYQKLKDSQPYEFFWLNEQSFQKIVEKIVNPDQNQNTILNNNLNNLVSANELHNKETKISTCGFIVENNLNENFCILKFDNSTLKLDLSRIIKNYKISKLPYFVYGSLKKKAGEIILFVDFFRFLNENFDFEDYKNIISNLRMIKMECDNLS